MFCLFCTHDVRRGLTKSGCGLRCGEGEARASPSASLCPPLSSSAHAVCAGLRDLVRDKRFINALNFRLRVIIRDEGTKVVRACLRLRHDRDAIAAQLALECYQCSAPGDTHTHLHLHPLHPYSAPGAVHPLHRVTPGDTRTFPQNAVREQLKHINTFLVSSESVHDVC